MLSVVAQIAHIRSEVVNGPRYDPTYPEDLVDEEENLFLLCGLHHKPVDEHASKYPVAELLEWKRRQVGTTPAASLTDPQMAEILRHYDLNSLDPMGFEKLCQALAARTLGIGTRIHGGYGPDGGRDASFDGQLDSYPSKIDPWAGYIVMQAKFIQAGNTPASANQFRNWIRHEVARWSPNGRLREAEKSADYLILATNISVPAAFGPDGWRRIGDLVRDISGNTLKGWEVWDEAKIFGLLDAYHDVRTAFAPLITSSRLVANLIDLYRNGPER